MIQHIEVSLNHLPDTSRCHFVDIIRLDFNLTRHFLQFNLKPSKNGFFNNIDGNFNFLQISCKNQNSLATRRSRIKLRTQDKANSRNGEAEIDKLTSLRLSHEN